MAQSELEARDADDNHPIDPHDIRVIAVQIAAQAEMHEQGLHEDAAA